MNCNKATKRIACTTACKHFATCEARLQQDALTDRILEATGTPLHGALDSKLPPVIFQPQRPHLVVAH